MPTVSFVADGPALQRHRRAVDRHRVGIRFGDFYARRLIEHLGLADRTASSASRWSTTTRLDEVDRLVAALDEALRQPA